MALIKQEGMLPNIHVKGQSLEGAWIVYTQQQARKQCMVAEAGRWIGQGRQIGGISLLIASIFSVKWETMSLVQSVKNVKSLRKKEII